MCIRDSQSDLRYPARAAEYEFTEYFEKAVLKKRLTFARSSAFRSSSSLFGRSRKSTTGTASGARSRNWTVATCA
jgi:hypothetical protein